MNSVCVVILGLVAVVAAHYEGYPFVHKNEGRYGAKYPYANYKQEEAKKEANYVHPERYGPYMGVSYGNMEYKYRERNGYPIHVGSGQFYFLGNQAGGCDKRHNYGFYFTGDESSFIVCDNGKVHRFQCPKGTKNRDQQDFQKSKAYGMNDMCSVNTLMK